MRQTDSRVGYLRLFVLGLVGAAVLAFVGEYGSSLPGLGSPLDPWEWEDQLGVPSDSGQQTVQRELAFVYVGSSTCAASNVDFLPEVILALKEQIAVQSVERRWQFVMIGVARDRSPSQGLAHLEAMGPFHEVTTGRGWLNIGVQRYVFADFPGRAATPQVLLILQDVERRSGAILGAEVLARKIGNVELQEWAHRGATIPQPASPLP